MAATIVTVAAVVVLLALALLARNLYRTSDWHRLHLARKGVRVHLTTDPACLHHVAPPRPGTRLWRAAAGHSCPICADHYAVTNQHGTDDGPW